ncbi:hypothetical protein HN51_012277 [Arachis hypogaea]|uniref:uncharacterized protein n=1 Tax=Arachis hypogaea TaxID=3818 RepID=UPI000DECFF9B|nr:uncharacterized protein At5g39865 [Arachis hypogaea]QHO57742.1 uncharacterized protein DS421_3g84860 [Arachis hypogaea]
MGCASSKGIDPANAGVYRPAPTSFAVFDINAIEEPWLKHLNNTPQTHQDEKPIPTHVPTPILHKLNMLDSTEAPQSWDEVSKALQDLNKPLQPPEEPPQKLNPHPQPRKTMSFHTLEELDAKLNPKPRPELTKAVTTNWKLNKKEFNKQPPPAPIRTSGKEEEAEEGGVRIKPVKDNIFIVRDRMERQKEEKESAYEKISRDPLSSFPEKCPPGGEEAVVLYTTSLGGVRKTYEECNRAREVLEGQRVVIDERDVSLHGEFLRELKEVLREEEQVRLPRVFVKGRYVGGLSELVELQETGRLRRILNASGVERGLGRQACGGCGGVRFVPCLDCGGSCKLPSKERCPNCNENGLVHCPACLSL